METNSVSPWGSRSEIPSEAVKEIQGEAISSTMDSLHHTGGADGCARGVSCPSPMQLKELVQETLADHLVEATSTHLETCGYCQATVERWLDGAAEEVTSPLLIPGYEIGAELGRGGMGIVYLARRLSDGASFALKVLAPHALDRPESLQRFNQEIATLNRLNHPGIVQIVESGVVDRQPWFAMELIGGPSLERFLDGKPLLPISVANFMLQITTAIEVAHQQRIVHRDLKPSNILLQPKNPIGQVTGRTLGAYQPKIVDFGIAKWLGQSTSTDLTRTGDIIGSLEYMSPEVLLGESRGDTRSDIYALGAVLYELLVGRPPISATTISELIRRVATESPIAPRKFDPTIPMPLERICMKCLHRQASDRYVSTEELRKDFERYLQGERILARPLPLPRRILLWGKQKPAAATALVLSTISISLIFCLLLWNQWRLVREKNKTEENLRLAVTTIEITFDEFFRLVGVLGDEGTTFDSGGIVDQQIEKLAKLEKQRPDDAQVQLLIARLEASRAENEKNDSIQQQDEVEKRETLERALALLTKSLERTSRLREGKFKIKSLRMHEHSCRLAAEMYRSLNDLDQARDILSEGYGAVDALKTYEPHEWRHTCRHLFLLMETSMITWIDWNSGRLGTPSMLNELARYEEEVADATKQLNELAGGIEGEAVAALHAVYEDLAEWYFLLGARLTPEHYRKALAYNQKAIAFAEQWYAMLPNSRSAYKIEKLLVNFCKVVVLDNGLDGDWVALRNSFYERLSRPVPLAMAGNRFVLLGRAIRYELDVVERELPKVNHLSQDQWKVLRGFVDDLYQSLSQETASVFSEDYEDLKRILDNRLQLSLPADQKQ